ncbi:hypothetical protein RHSP_69824 [Rhizobium freirei PRF 81]|uniref:Uncharacterized protein n=1 Tax=Rhizobium freirei PRF 81 TaxID=363754 RepID=N6VF12_9HYPH|nr:hypothetical protein RHSP_69824 [Rhizobium freirei PRF 81]
MAVSDRLAHGDNVRNHALGFESPPMAADAAETDLHFVGKAEAARRPHHGIDFLQIPVRKEDLAGNARDRFRQEERGSPPFFSHAFNLFGDAFGKALAMLFRQPFFRGAIAIRDDGFMDMIRTAFAALALVFVGAEIDQLLRRAVIGPVDDDRVVASGMVARHAKHQAIRLASRAGKGCHRQAFGQCRGQALGVFDDIVVQVARIGVEQLGLARKRFDDVGMRMSEMADIVEAIEIGSAVIVDQPDAVAANEFDRLGIGDREIGQQQLFALGHQLFPRSTILNKGLGRQTGKRRRIREEFGPDIEIGGFTNAQDLCRRQRGIGRNLEVEMRSPAAVFVNVAHIANEITGFQALARRQPGERLMRHVPPKGHEGQAAFGGMFERDEAAIAKRLVFDLDASDSACHRSVKRRSGGHEQIDAEVMDAALALDEARFKGLIRVDGSFFAPRPDAEFDPVLFGEVRPPFGRLLRTLFGRGNGHDMRRVAVRDDRLAHRGSRRTDDIGKALPVVGNPAADRAGTINRIEAARLAQNGCGKTRVHGIHLFEQTPSRRLADRKIWIVTGLIVTRSGEGDARHQAHGDEVEQDVDLFRLQRILFMEAGNQSRRRTDRILHIQDRVSAGNGNFCDQDGVDGVAEIDEARDSLIVMLIDQNIPVVGIIVDDLRPQPREPGLDEGFETLDEAPQERPLLGVADKMQARTRPRRMAQIPIELAQRAWMDKTLQRPIELSERPAEAAHQVERSTDLRKRRPSQPADQAQGVRLAVRGYRGGQKIAREARLQMRNHKLRIGAGKMVQKSGLEFAFDLRLAGVDDLQDPAVIGFRLQTVVAVTLAIEC